MQNTNNIVPINNNLNLKVMNMNLQVFNVNAIFMKSDN